MIPPDLVCDYQYLTYMQDKGLTDEINYWSIMRIGIKVLDSNLIFHSEPYCSKFIKLCHTNFFFLKHKEKKLRSTLARTLIYGVLLLFFYSLSDTKNGQVHRGG